MLTTAAADQHTAPAADGHNKAPVAAYETSLLRDEITKKRKLKEIEDLKLATATDVRFTASFLGAGQKQCGGTECAKRRKLLLDKVSVLGAGLSAQQRGNFCWFKEEYDKAGQQFFGDEWPDQLLRKVKGVLDALPHRGDAFSRFVYSEERNFFTEEYGLTVPPTRGAMLALQN